MFYYYLYFAGPLVEIDQYPLAFFKYSRPLVIVFRPDIGWRGLKLQKNGKLVLGIVPITCGYNSSSRGYFVSCRDNTVTLTDLHPTEGDIWKVEAVYPIISVVNITNVRVKAGKVVILQFAYIYFY